MASSLRLMKARNFILAQATASVVVAVAAVSVVATTERETLRSVLGVAFPVAVASGVMMLAVVVRYRRFRPDAPPTGTQVRRVTVGFVNTVASFAAIIVITALAGTTYPAGTAVLSGLFGGLGIAEIGVWAWVRQFEKRHSCELLLGSPAQVFARANR